MYRRASVRLLYISRPVGSWSVTYRDDLALPPRGIGILRLHPAVVGLQSHVAI